MKMILTPATTADEYLGGLSDWQQAFAEAFKRGQRLRHIEPRLKSGGKYELATLELHRETPLLRETVVQLAVEAERLNCTLGDPTHAARAKV